jgi:hypothetical protein
LCGVIFGKETKRMRKNELDTFLKLVHTTEFESGLLFWNAMKNRLPILSQIACGLLVTPATSVASESAFSQSAFVLRKQRMRLAGKTVKKLMFLKDKY